MIHSAINYIYTIESILFAYQVMINSSPLY